MSAAAVLYATRQGQTRRIAEHIAEQLRVHGVATDLFDVKTLGADVDVTGYAIVCVAASVHRGRHERELIAFVKRHRVALDRARAVFVSVSLSEAGAEDPAAPTARRERAAADVRRMIDDFVAQTGWRPALVMPVAGALTYSRYNFLLRFAMKRIARANGVPTDASRDYEFTDWNAIDRFAADLCRVSGTPPAASTTSR